MLRWTLFIASAVFCIALASEGTGNEFKEAESKDGNDAFRKGTSCILTGDLKRGCSKKKDCCSRNCVGGTCQAKIPLTAASTTTGCVPGGNCGGFAGIPCCGNLHCVFSTPTCADCFGKCSV